MPRFHLQAGAPSGPIDCFDPTDQQIDGALDRTRRYGIEAHHRLRGDWGMTTYEQLRSDFSWPRVWEGFDWDAPATFNITHETVTRNVGQGPALYWEGEDGDNTVVRYADLEEESARVANALESLGTERGESVATLVPRVPELYPMFLGIWRMGAVYLPLFTAFGPKAIEQRAGDAAVDTVITTPGYREKITAVENAVGFEHVLVLDRDDEGIASGDRNYQDLITTQPTEYETVQTTADDTCTLEYTSGTTGPPKGCELTHRVLAALYPYLDCSMDLDDTEVLWGAADPGWMYGLLTAGVAPVSKGVPNVMYEGEFAPDEWYRIMETYEVTSLATSPTAYRGLMAEGDLYEQYELALRKGNSAGEPLNPEVIRWFEEKLDVPVYDHYGVTECGMVAGNHHACDMEVRPGSMGRPLPGFAVRILNDGDQADVEQVGEIAVRRGEGTYFDGYYERPEQTRAAWIAHDGAEWFATGDAAYRDADGYFWFVGRDDDVIVSAGYRIGPFEVESTLIEHEAIAEAAAVGVPDDERGEIVKAFVVPRSGYEADETLREDIRGFVRDRLAQHAYPREIAFTDALPKTSSGKIRRIELRERE